MPSVLFREMYINLVFLKEEMQKGRGKGEDRVGERAPLSCGDEDTAERVADIKRGSRSVSND